MNSRIKELLSNTFLFAIANMGSKILVFLMVPLYTAILSTEEYGISDMVHTTAQMLMPILTAMIADAVLRFCFLQDVDRKNVFSIGIRLLFLGFCACVGLSILFLFIPFFESIGLFVLFIPVVFLSQSLINLFHKFARGVGEVKVSAIAGLLSTSIVIVLNLLFLLVFKWGIIGYLLAYSIADILSVVYIAYKCKATQYWTNVVDKNLLNQMTAYSLPLIPNQISWWALSSINRYIMLAWCGIGAVGIYSATLRIPSILTVLADIFAQAWLLSALKDYGTDESKRFISSMHSKYFSLLILVTSIIILLSYPLASILLTGDFSSYWWVSPFLFISVFWGALVGFLGSIFSAERKNKMQFISTIIGALVSILITILFIREYGVIVVAIATWAGFFIIWLVRRVSVNQFIDLEISTISAVVQGSILLVQAVFVKHEFYTYAILCTLLLAILNYKNLVPIIRFAIDTIKENKNKFTKQ